MARTDRNRRSDTDSIETSLNRRAHVARVQELRRSSAAAPFADRRRPKGGRQGSKIETRRMVMA